MGIRNKDVDYSFIIWEPDVNDSGFVAPVVEKGSNNVALVNDIYCFAVKSYEDKDVTLTMIFKTKQAIADKNTGTGTAIKAGEKVYLITATGKVTGVAGSNKLIGYCVRDAADSDDTVDISFDGTIYS